MPAITVDDVTILPRVGTASATPREVVSISTAPRGFEGEGFPVRRAFAGVPLEHLDPFIHMDQGAQGHTVAPAPGLRDGHLHH